MRLPPMKRAAVLATIERLDAINRERALTAIESAQLEQLIYRDRLYEYGLLRALRKSRADQRAAA